MSNSKKGINFTVLTNNSNFAKASTRVLRDSNLTDAAKVLFIAISDTPQSSKLSLEYQQSYLGWKKDKVSIATACLKLNGYLKMIKFPLGKGNGFNYTYIISEFGNLGDCSINEDRSKKKPVITKEPIIEVKTISNDTIIPQVKEEPLKEVKTMSNDELELERAVRTEIKRIVDKVINVKPFTGGNKEIRSGKVQQLYRISLGTYNKTGEFPTEKEILNKRLSLQSAITALKTSNQDQRYQN